MTRGECEAIRLEGMEHYGFGPEAMKRTRVCTCCGTAASVEETRCPACGAALPRETLFDLYCRQHHCCPACGALLEVDGNFCPHCGKKLR